MTNSLQDRQKILFGREPDVLYLAARAKQSGVTIVVGRAQMGKSWLLTELARRLTTDTQAPYLVGFTESFGETADLFLRAVADLYTRWLSDSSYWKQAKVVWRQGKTDFVGKAGKAVGSVFEKLAKLGSPASEAVGGMVKEVFEELASTNQDCSPEVYTSLGYKSNRHAIYSRW